MNTRVQVRQADGTVRYDQEHRITVSISDEVTFDPHLPPVLNGETLAFDHARTDAAPDAGVIQQALRLRNEAYRATPVRDDTRDAHFALEELRIVLVQTIRTRQAPDVRNPGIRESPLMPRWLAYLGCSLPLLVVIVGGAVALIEGRA